VRHDLSTADFDRLQAALAPVASTLVTFKSLFAPMTLATHFDTHLAQLIPSFTNLRRLKFAISENSRSWPALVQGLIALPKLSVLYMVETETGRAPKDLARIVSGRKKKLDHLIYGKTRTRCGSGYDNRLYADPELEAACKLAGTDLEMISGDPWSSSRW